MLLSVAATLPLAGCNAAPPPAADPPVNAVELTPAQQVVALVGDPNAPADQRREALIQITRSTAAGEPVYLDFYRALLNDPGTDPTLAALAATALANFGRPEDVRQLTPLLDRPEAFLRWRAAAALRRLHHPDAVGPLMQRVNTDEDADVRLTSALALGQYPRRDVFDTLVTALDDRASGVARAARDSLVLLNSHDAGDDPRAWLDYAERADPLFAPGRYTFSPYPPARGFPGFLLFWIEPTLTPRTPTGYTDPTS
jgi:HEAT repeat protein